MRQLERCSRGAACLLAALTVLDFIAMGAALLLGHRARLLTAAATLRAEVESRFEGRLGLLQLAPPGASAVM